MADKKRVRRKVSRGRLTPKQRVIRKHPGATAYQWAGPQGWIIYTGGYINRALNDGHATAAQAWAAAMRRM